MSTTNQIKLPVPNPTAWAMQNGEDRRSENTEALRLRSQFCQKSRETDLGSFSQFPLIREDPLLKVRVK